MKTTIKRIQEHLGVAADGVVGPITIAAAADRLKVARTLLSIQREVGAVPDGVFGPETASKLFSALGLGWPSQAEVRSGKSIFGKPGVESNLVSITPPYPLYFAGKQLKTIRVHKLIAKAVLTALEEVLDHYGIDEIKRLGLDKFDGAYNYRKSRGGSSLSMHAWGVALDWNAAKNAMNMKAGQASLSRPECRAWWNIWEKQGAVSLGRARNYDWMHVQFATL